MRRHISPATTILFADFEDAMTQRGIPRLGWLLPIITSAAAWLLQDLAGQSPFTIPVLIGVVTVMAQMLWVQAERRAKNEARQFQINQIFSTEDRTIGLLGSPCVYKLRLTNLTRRALSVYIGAEGRFWRWLNTEPRRDTLGTNGILHLEELKPGQDFGGAEYKMIPGDYVVFAYSSDFPGGDSLRFADQVVIVERHTLRPHSMLVLEVVTPLREPEGAPALQSIHDKWSGRGSTSPAPPALGE